MPGHVADGVGPVGEAGVAQADRAARARELERVVHQVVLALCAQPVDHGKVILQFSVTDTGEGIAPDVLKRLFLAFEQADNSMTRSVGGAGVGLTVSRGLLDLMGSGLHIESTLGEGSAFSFALECAVADSAGDDA